MLVSYHFARNLIANHREILQAQQHRHLGCSHQAQHGQLVTFVGQTIQLFTQPTNLLRHLLRNLLADHGKAAPAFDFGRKRGIQRASPRKISFALTRIGQRRG